MTHESHTVGVFIPEGTEARILTRTAQEWEVAK